MAFFLDTGFISPLLTNTWLAYGTGPPLPGSFSHTPPRIACRVPTFKFTLFLLHTAFISPLLTNEAESQSASFWQRRARARYAASRAIGQPQAMAHPLIPIQVSSRRC
jgi:hypothetical protein